MFHFPCYLEIFSMVIQPKSSVFHSFSMLFHPRLENAWKKSPRFMDISRTKPWKTLETVSNSRDFHGIPCYTMDFQPKFHDYPGQCTPGKPSTWSRLDYRVYKWKQICLPRNIFSNPYKCLTSFCEGRDKNCLIRKLPCKNNKVQDKTGIKIRSALCLKFPPDAGNA